MVIFEHIQIYKWLFDGPSPNELFTTDLVDADANLWGELEISLDNVMFGSNTGL